MIAYLRFIGFVCVNFLVGFDLVCGCVAGVEMVCLLNYVYDLLFTVWCFGFLIGVALFNSVVICSFFWYFGLNLFWVVVWLVVVRCLVYLFIWFNLVVLMILPICVIWLCLVLFGFNVFAWCFVVYLRLIICCCALRGGALDWLV